MDGAEKLLSISQCQTTVVYSVTVLSALGRKHSSGMVVTGGRTEYGSFPEDMIKIWKFCTKIKEKNTSAELSF
jgi:hypothetical protein